MNKRRVVHLIVLAVTAFGALVGVAGQHPTTLTAAGTAPGTAGVTLEGVAPSSWGWE